MSLQLKQTERNQRALLNQGAILRVTEAAMWTGRPELSALIGRVSLNEMEFSNEELWQLVSVFRVAVLSMQDAIVQHDRKLIDDATLDNAVRGFQFWVRRPVMRRLYGAMRQNIALDARNRLDKLIETTPIAVPLDLRDVLQAELNVRRT